MISKTRNPKSEARKFPTPALTLEYFSGSSMYSVEPSGGKSTERGYQTNPFAGELFNLRDDLTQSKNLYGEKPEMVQRLKVLLEKYKTEGRSVALPVPQSARE